MPDEATPAKKKRKKPVSATQMTLKELRKEGYECAIVEKVIPHCFIKQDCFGFIDILAIRGDIIGIQATANSVAGSNGSTRMLKILAEPRAKRWLQAGGRIQVWWWRRKLNTAKTKDTWQKRVTEITLAHFNGDVVGDPIKDADGLFATPTPVSVDQGSRLGKEFFEEQT